MPALPKILVVSSVVPKPTGFGEIILHRHLGGESDPAVNVVPHPPRTKFWRAIRRTPLRGWLDTVEVLGNGRRWDAPARALAESCQPRVVLTVAHGDGWHAASRLARQHRLPLVTFFHDWWPDLLPAQLRAGEENRFRAVYRESRAALCVCDGMRQALGSHPDSRVLLPIPGKSGTTPGTVRGGNQKDGRFRIFYSGNLREYAPMLRSALETMEGHPHIRLETRGMSPRWPATFRNQMRALGLWHDFAPRAELERWLNSADAYLIVMPFEPAMRRMTETAFPSKLTEFARFGRPLVIWGPEYCSAIQWGRQADRALCVTHPEPAALRSALEKLARTPDEQRRLSEAAMKASTEDFDPDEIQRAFLAAIAEATANPATKQEIRPTLSELSSVQ